MAELRLLYRLIILQMLDRSSVPLSNTTITGFMLDQEYTTYFTIQQSFMDLLNADLITAESTHNNTLYHITEEGAETLSFFSDKISDSIKRDIAQYLDSNHVELATEASVTADYYKSPEGRYSARCQVFSGANAIVDLTLEVSSKEQAEAICRNWQSQHIEVYTSLMDLLLQ